MKADTILFCAMSICLFIGFALGFWQGKLTYGNKIAMLENNLMACNGVRK